METRERLETRYNMTLGIRPIVRSTLPKFVDPVSPTSITTYVYLGLASIFLLVSDCNDVLYKSTAGSHPHPQCVFSLVIVIV
jgi:hypothetical protein